MLFPPPHAKRAILSALDTLFFGAKQHAGLTKRAILPALAILRWGDKEIPAPAKRAILPTLATLFFGVKQHAGLAKRAILSALAILRWGGKEVPAPAKRAILPALATTGFSIQGGPAEHHAPTPGGSLPPAWAHYRPISQHYRAYFGEKVQKISITAAHTCPNRLGIGGMQVCSFCDVWGSAADERTHHQPIAQQIKSQKPRLQTRYQAKRFLAYLQAYTTTFARASRVERWCKTALEQEGVVGVVIGSRPDCLPKPMLAILQQLARQTYVSVELGLQSINNDQLRFLRRGHDAASGLDALKQLADCSNNLHPGVHLMFGFPSQTPSQWREQLEYTAQCLQTHRVHNVKLHNLHVLKHTALATQYAQGQFVPISLAEYAQQVAHFLSHLPQHVFVHRLNAVASRWSELVAPSWTREKMRPRQVILDTLARQDIWQGKQLGQAKQGLLSPAQNTDIPSG